jgi:polyketide synthase 12
VIAAIPVKRLRQAGVLELLLELAGDAHGDSAPETREQNIADMDLDDLLNAALDGDDE